MNKTTESRKTFTVEKKNNYNEIKLKLNIIIKK